MLRYLLGQRKSQPRPTVHGEACVLLHMHEIITALECAQKVDLRVVTSVGDVVALQRRLGEALKGRSGMRDER